MWRLVNGTEIPGYVDPQRQALNPPDGGPGDDGGPGMPSGPGGPGRPGPAGPNGPGAPNGNNANARNNPDYDPLMKIAEAIAK